MSKLTHATLQDFSHVEVNNAVKPLKFGAPIRESMCHGGAGTTQEKLKHFIHSRAVHQIILALVLLDLLFVVFGILFEIQHLHSEVDDMHDILHDHAHYGCVVESHDDSADSHAESSDSHSETETTGHARRLGEALVCTVEDTYGNDNLKDLEHTMAYCSLAILCIFIVENILVIIAEGKNYCNDYKHMYPHYFDFVLVVISFVLECITLGGEPELQLIIIGRLWRIARVGEGVFHAKDETAEIRHLKSIQKDHA